MRAEPAHEHEYEPIPGLPEKLPRGEVILWQGRPNGRAIARRVMKTRWFTAYFVILAGWAMITGLYDGRGIGESLFSAGALLVLGTITVGLIELYAWGVEKTTLYTITNQRIVMRIGVALPFTMNLPFARIISADIRRLGSDIGDVAVRIHREERISWLMTWPHVRALRIFKAEPALRCIPKVEEAGQRLADALRKYNDAETPRISVERSDERPAGPEDASVSMVGAAE